MLAKLFQVIVKLKFKKQLERENLIEPPQSTVERMTSALQAKIRLAFRDENDLLQWMNLAENNMVRPDEFWFGFQYFCANITAVESLALFSKLDKNKDGLLDCSEIRSLIAKEESWDSPEFKRKTRNMKYGLVQEREDLRNSFKWAVSPSEELDLPHLSKLRKEKFTLMQRGKEVAHKFEKMNLRQSL